MRFVREFAADDGGATAIEYSMITSLVFFAIFAAISSVASGTTAMWDKVATHV
jgi:Flp pilus assembly pilin Flp